MTATDNSDKSKENRIEVKLLKPGHRFSLNMFDSDNNLILEAHTPISPGVLNHLRNSGIQFLYFDPSKIGEMKDGPLYKTILSDELKEETYTHTKNLLEEIRFNLTNAPDNLIGKGLIDKSRSLVDRIITDTEKNSDGVYDVVTKLKDMDDYYYNHSMNVAIIASILGSRLDFKPDVKSAMGVGGLFHDIGFTSVSKDILHKAQLNDSDFDIIKSHTHVGYKFVEKNPLMHEIEKRIILLHHERGDGEGYPYGFDLDMYQNNVPREVRLLGLIDTFVILTMPKPGQEGMTPKVAMRLMVNMIHAPYKTKYSFIPMDVRDFLRALGFIINKGESFMKAGDLVRISTGEIGIIEEMNRLYPMNPKVRILRNSRGEPLKRPVVLDLIKTYQEYVSNIYDRNASGKFSLNDRKDLNRI
ncbi:MAG TPA: HD domain-containing protein [Spirochaetota bacterium]|nr:HD domain-containing protein [Spirochaetota bacterium]